MLSQSSSKALSLYRRFSRIFFKLIVGITNMLPESIRHNIIIKTPLRHVYYRYFKSVRPQRVFLKNGLSLIEFFKILNQRKVEYVLLRWWEGLPDYPGGEDINILVKDEHRDLIDDLTTIYNSRGIKCDIYTVSGAKNGSRINVPVFPYNLTNALLNTRYFFNGAYVPAPLPYFASVAYHAVFHKGHNSGVPGFKLAPTKHVYDYTTFLKEMAFKLGISVEITVTGLFNWLKKEGFAPANDTLTKLVENRPELSLLETSLCSDARGGELLVYVIRERLLHDGLLHDFKVFLEDKYQLDVIDIRELNAAEKSICTSQIRGGKWDNGPFKYSGGPPVALVVAYDYHPRPLSTAEQKKQTRVTNQNNIGAKYDFRERVQSLVLIKGDYNGLHSADNEQDAWCYISLIGEDYRNKISVAVDRRRKRYARKWGVEKVVSTGPLFKVEIIKYGKRLAIKKTFRPGKERYFERELFAVKELSKELEFIPPLLEEGEGYIVIPYLENILNNLSEKEKKQILASKRHEIVRVIHEMYSRGLTYLNFNPANIIVTSDNKFYCTGFELLQEYDYSPPTIDDAYEVTGFPRRMDGEYPQRLNTKINLFNKIWGPYIGHWEGAAYSYKQA